MDGVPLLGNTHLQREHPERCGCGGYGGSPGPHTCSPRAHHFWECPVAKAVVEQITNHVPGPLTRAHLWLVEAPPSVQQCVWDVVALAAITAMERARVGLRAAMGRTSSAASGGAGPDQQAPPAPIEVAKARAVLEFWQRLRGFAELGVPRKGWEGVGPDHPILSVSGDGCMRCVQPQEELEGGNDEDG